MDGFTGFNPGLVNRCIDRVQEAYEAVMNTVANEVVNQFIVPMGDVMASPNIIKEFEKIKKLFEDSEAEHGMFANISKNFGVIISRIGSAGTAWANQSGTDCSFGELDIVQKTIDISAIKPNLSNGEIGVNPNGANSVLAKLNVIAAKVNEDLNNARNAINDSGFLGVGQEQSLMNLVGEIGAVINEGLETVSEVTRKMIEETLEEYGDFASNVSDAFSS